MGDEKFNLLNCLLLDWELYLSIRNSGIITEQYNLKYVIVRDGFIIYRRLVIHPIWVIDEYAIIVRRWDWFIPIIPPRSALIAEINKINDVAVLLRINDRIIKGANFCHDARIEHEIHDREVITEGNQKWKGAIPNFSIIADINKRFI